MKTISLRKFAEAIEETIQLEDTVEKLRQNKKAVPQDLEKKLKELQSMRVVVSMSNDKDLLGSI